MKSYGDLLKELGFNPNAPESVQKAFFQHLAQQAESVQRPQPQDQGPVKHQTTPKKNEQLTIDFDSVGTIDCIYKNNKKVS